MAARTRKIRHDDETLQRFYVYELSDGSSVKYVGKGTDGRLQAQVKRTGLFGEIVKRFRSEKEAYRFEVKLIGELNPPLNKNGGGGGSKSARKMAPKEPSWVKEIEEVGSRRYTARELLKLDLSGLLDASKIDAIRQVANGPRA